MKKTSRLKGIIVNNRVNRTRPIKLLKHLGFDIMIKGSHHIFRKQGIIEKINLQREGNMAKPYQVKQARNVIVKYRLGGTIDV